MLRIVIYLLAGYGLYYLLLKNSPGYGFRRAYLMALLISAGFVPVGSLLSNIKQIPSFSLPGITTFIPADTNSISGSAASMTSMYTFFDLVKVVYLIGAAIAMILFIIQLIKLINCFRNSSPLDDYKVLHRSNMAFSTFGTIFIGDELLDNKSDLSMIVEHERKHVRMGHSYDLLLLSVYSIVFWFIPIWRSFRKELSLIHELQVDEAILQKYDRVNYAQLLIKRSTGTCGLPVPCFGQFLTKKRLQAMIKKKNYHLNPMTALLFVLPLMAMWIGVSCTQEPVENSSALKEDEASVKTISNKDEIFQVVEEMPVILECVDDSKAKEEIKKCSNTKLLQLIYSNVVYPKSAQKDAKEGTVVCSFIVDKRGFTRDIKLVRAVDADLDKAALDAMEKIVEKGNIWKPGVQSGKAVSVEYKLPIKFKLEG